MKKLFLLILSLFVFSCNSGGGKVDNNCSLNDDCLLLIGEWTGVTEDYDFESPGCDPYEDIIDQDASGRLLTFGEDCAYSFIYDYEDEYDEGDGSFECSGNEVTICDDANNPSCITAIYTFIDNDPDVLNAIWTQTEDQCTYTVSLDLYKSDGGSNSETETPPHEGGSGCTDAIACNYNPYADYDDGSCIYADICP